MGTVLRRTVPLLAVVWAATLGGAGGIGAAAAADGSTVTANSAQIGPEGTSVVLRGSYSCGPFTSGVPDRGVIDLSIVQARGGHEVAAIGYLEPSVCDGTLQPFEVTLTATGGQRLRAGEEPGPLPVTWKATRACSTSRSPPLGSRS